MTERLSERIKAVLDDYRSTVLQCQAWQRESDFLPEDERLVAAVAQLESDAELGALVRRMPSDCQLQHLGVWTTEDGLSGAEWVVLHEHPSAYCVKEWTGDTPEDALRKALGQLKETT